MKKNKLGRTDIEVTDFCLGSMTWGTQNTAKEGHAQIERALDAGINFIDTAEMYPVNPVRAETIGRTEEIIGEWIGSSGRRSDFVLATKHSGEGAPVRDGAGISSDTSGPRSRRRSSGCKPITSTSISFIGPTGAAICFARTGSLIRPRRTVPTPWPTWTTAWRPCKTRLRAARSAASV